MQLGHLSKEHLRNVQSIRGEQLGLGQRLLARLLVVGEAREAAETWSFLGPFAADDVMHPLAILGYTNGYLSNCTALTGYADFTPQIRHQTPALSEVTSRSTTMEVGGAPGCKPDCKSVYGGSIPPATSISPKGLRQCDAGEFLAVATPTATRATAMARKSRTKLPYVQRRKIPGTDVVVGYRGWATKGGKRVFSESYDNEADAYNAAMRMRDAAEIDVPAESLDAACDAVLAEVELKRTAGNLRWYGDHLRAVRRLIPGKTNLHSIVPETIEQFIRDRLQDYARQPSDTHPGRRIKPATVNADLRALHRVFAVAIRRGVINDNPVRKVDRPRQDAPAIDWFTDKELRDLLARIDDEHTCDVIKLFALTGVRRSEASRILKEHVRLRLRQLVIYAGKRSTRIVPLSEDLDAPIRRLMAGADTHLLPGGTKALDLQFKHAKAAAKDPRLKMHALRHTFGTALIRSGVRPDVVMRLMGHRSIETTLIYVHEVGQDGVDAVSLLRLVPPDAPEQGLGS